MHLTPAMQNFILHWGDMGAKWGVNRSVAQIHALLHISPEPLTADEICDTLKLAMVKNRMLAETLFNGEIYDCVMKFETMRGGLSAHPVTT